MWTKNPHVNLVIVPHEPKGVETLTSGISDADLVSGSKPGNGVTAIPQGHGDHPVFVLEMFGNGIFVLANKNCKKLWNKSWCSDFFHNTPNLLPNFG